ncbi:uncharacterized protein [Rhodnius prolixus]|uniref:uncharacterized protein n=1 Tax=Rhodnius prolixus TaxID=13249 RepID=UPI003D18D488
MKKDVIGFQPINDRICTLRLKGKFANLSLISVHAPTEDTEAETKEEFYAGLEQVYNRIPNHDVKLLLGDFNAKVGKEQDYRPTIGLNSVHEVSNDNGCRLIDFATDKTLRVVSTSFPHKRIHLQTWISPDGVTRNQIDHILIDARHATNIQDVRSYRGADIDSDHLLVRAKLKQKVAIRTQGKGVKRRLYNSERLRLEAEREAFRNKCEELLKEIVPTPSEGIEGRWKWIKESMQRAAEETLGIKRKETRNGWYDEEVEEVLKRRNEARQRMLVRRTRASAQEYRRERAKARLLCRKKKRELERSLVEQMQLDFDQKRGRKFYKAVKNIKDGYQPRTGCIESAEGRLMAGKEEVINRWMEYFQEVLNSQGGLVLEEEDIALDDDAEPPSMEDFDNVVETLKANKAPGEDSIEAEMVKLGGDRIRKEIYDLILEVWLEERMPREWASAMIFPIHKKGNRLKCSNYRGISLLSVVYKILATLITERVSIVAERVLGEYQCGFRKGRSTTDHIFTMRTVLESFYENNLDLHQLYVDFRMAYDSVSRTGLIRGMKLLGVPFKIIRLVRMTLNQTSAKVVIQGEVSTEFGVNVGLRQGDPVSPVLFNLVLEMALRRVTSNPGGTIYNRMTQHLAYADDVVIIARSVSELKKEFLELEEGTAMCGLRVHEEKTKYMVTTRNERRLCDLEVGQHRFEGVGAFKYLGTTLTSKNEVGQDIRSRLTAGNKCLGALKRTLRKKDVSRKAKITIYKTVIRPVVMYGSETWTLTVAEEARLDCWERKVLRCLFGPLLYSPMRKAGHL